MSHDSYPTSSNRRGALIAGVSATTLALVLAGCADVTSSGQAEASPIPNKTVTVATCNPHEAGKQVMPTKGYPLTEFQTKYDVVIDNANGKQLRTLDLLVTNVQSTNEDNATHRVDDIYPSVYESQYDDPSMDGQTGNWDGPQNLDTTDLVEWEGDVQQVTKTTIEGTTANQQVNDESFITSLTCPDADSLLYQPDGTSTTQVSQ